jgi:starch phosphorylase
MPDKAMPSKMRPLDDIRTGLTPASIKQDIVDNLNLIRSRVPATASQQDWYQAVAFTVRDRILALWMHTIEDYLSSSRKSVSYLSAEFLIGPQLMSNMLNLNIVAEMQSALNDLGLNLEDIIKEEPEPGLGNGGLGRLAACFMDSLASLEILAVGYGIRYEFGIFKQTIQHGWQVEMADLWLHLGNPWEILHAEICFNVGFGGSIHEGIWTPAYTIRGVACDTPILGYKVKTVNLLRLWKAEAADSFDFQAYNAGDYWRAVEDKISSENITKVLYPNDESTRGKRLRLEQQYFFVSCSLQDMIRVHFMRGYKLLDFHKHYAIQLNDTHPSIAIAELMRLFLDVHNMDWDMAWDITQKTFAYTNHTLMPEALEKWSLPLFQSLLPRHLEIIYAINGRFLNDLRKRQVDIDTIRNVSIIDESGEKSVRMAHLAAIGCHTINGVAELHTELLKCDVMADFHKLMPAKFQNVTNGVTPRRWLALCNPLLTRLISDSIGSAWISNMESEIIKLEPLSTDASFQDQWKAIKHHNKELLSNYIWERTGIKVDPYSLFDIQVKRIHEYKRQHLNVLHIIWRYLRIKKNPKDQILPRTCIFGGKAAPGYFLAKLIIKLINAVADKINDDPDVNDLLKVVFLPDFNVKNGHTIYPAAELSEQISTAGKEASGTGNMKFSMNGSLTIGTLDGANIEIRQAVGPENFFLFGLTAEEIYRLDCSGYNPQALYHSNEELREVLNLIQNGYFTPKEPTLFKPLVDALIYSDPYKLLADFSPYIRAQSDVDAAYGDQKSWTQKSILNVARIGKFSSDRSIREYASNIWNVSQ